METEKTDEGKRSYSKIAAAGWEMHAHSRSQRYEGEIGRERHKEGYLQTLLCGWDRSCLLAAPVGTVSRDSFRKESQWADDGLFTLKTFDARPQTDRQMGLEAVDRQIQFSHALVLQADTRPRLASRTGVVQDA